MSLLCSNLDKLIENNRFWELNCKLGPYTENNITFFIDKGTILTIKNDFNDELIGYEKSCFQIIYYSKIIKGNIIYKQNEDYYKMLQYNKLPDLYNYTLKIDLNYCIHYESKLDNNFKKSIKIFFTK